MNQLFEAEFNALHEKAKLADSLAQQVNTLQSEVARIKGLLNSPELVDFSSAVVREAAHQRERWSSESDAGKGPNDWIWLVGVLAGRALDHHKAAERMSVLSADEEVKTGPFLTSKERLVMKRELYAPLIEHGREKAVHHCITAAAVLANWHAHMLGLYTAMRPGTDTTTVPE